MKRPLFWIGLSMLFLVWVSYYCAGGAPFATLVPTVMLLLLLCGQKVRVTLPLFLCVALLCYVLVQADLDGLAQQSKLSAGREVEAVVTITKTQALSGRLRLEGVADIADGSGGVLADNLPLSFYLPAGELPEYARNIRVSGILLPSQNLPSSKEFTLREAKLLDTETTAADSFAALCADLRAWLTRRIFAASYGQTPPLLAALLLGDSTYLSPGQRSSLSAAGLSHLIAVSGLHLSIFMGLADRWTKKGRKLPQAAAQLFSCWGFSALTGMSVSVQRAALMYTLMILAGLFSRRSDPLTSLGTAVGIILLFDPSAALSYAIWLSSFATGGILLLAGPIERALTLKRESNLASLYNRFISVMSVTLAAQIATLPLLILMNQIMSVWSILANIPAVSLVGVLLPLGYLSLLPIISPLLSPIVRMLSLLLIRIATVFSQLRQGQLFVNERYQLIWLFGSYLLVVLLLRYKAERKLMQTAALLSAASLATLFFWHQCSVLNSAELLFNQSKTLLAVVRADRAVLCGNAEGRADYEQMAAALTRLGVRQIDCLLLTDGQAPDSFMGQLLAQFHCRSISTTQDYQNRQVLGADGYLVYTAEKPLLSPLGISVERLPDRICFYFCNATLLKFSDGCDILTEEKQYRLLSEGSILRYRFYLTDREDYDDRASAEKGAFAGKLQRRLFAVW